MGYIIGFDLGSQSAKAVLLSPDGELLATSSSSYGMQHPYSGWADQDPAEYRRALAEAVNGVLTLSGIAPALVTHIGLSSQVDGVIALDRQLKPLRPAIIWLDRRATAQVDALDRSIGAAELFQRTGLNLDASHTAPKMMWLRDHEPEVYQNATALVSVGGYAISWLVGRAMQDHANSSSTLLYDLRTRDWSDELIDAAGLDRRLLPEIGVAHEVAGTLTAEAAAALGLSRSCQVVTGTGDDHAASLGAGGVVPGVVIDILGTAEPVGVASPELVFDDSRLLETHAHAVDGSFLIENPGFVSGGNTMWFAGQVLGVSQQDFFDLAGQSAPGARGVRFIPALSGSMAPRWNDRMRGSFAGLSMNHGSADMARAIIEANTFAFRDIYDRLGELGLAGEVRVVGGGARSDLWLQAKATICRSPIRRVETQETSAVGAALLAGTAAGTYRDLLEGVERTVRVSTTTIDPDDSLTAHYDDAYSEYRELFAALETTTFKENQHDSRN